MRFVQVANFIGNSAMFLTIFGFGACPQAATHVFWYKAKDLGYNLQAASPGPGIPAAAVIYQGMSATGAIAQHTGSQTGLGVAFGAGLDDAQGRCFFAWFKDLDNATGTVTSAKIRAEFKDGWCGNALCNAGPIQIRCGVVDFQGNIDTWGGADYVPDMADWQDFLNPLGSAMGYDLTSPTLRAEEVIHFTAPAGRPSEFAPSVLDGKFFEIDVTDQVNWILQNNGRHAIVFLVNIGGGSTGKVWGYADESFTAGLLGCTSDIPWTADGNTLHLWADGVISFAGGLSDATRPVISNVKATPYYSSSGSSLYAYVTWTTNESSTSKVIYGTGGYFTSTAMASGSAYSHSVYLSYLYNYYTYNYKVISADAAGNAETSGVYYIKPDQPPTFTTTPSTVDTTALEDAPYTQTVNAVDPDSGDRVTYSMISYLSGMTINASTGLISWTPANASVGRWQVRVKAADLYGRSDTLAYYITVINVNDPPVIQTAYPGKDTAITEGDSLNLWVMTADPDLGDTIRFYWFLNGQLFKNELKSTQISSITLKTDLSSAGTDSVKLLAFDGKAQVEKRWVISIRNRALPPEPILPVPGAIVTADSIIGWSPSTDPDLKNEVLYRVQLSKFSDFRDSGGFTSDTESVSALKIRGLKSADPGHVESLFGNAVVFWRVEAVNRQGYRTGWSPSRYFVLQYKGDAVERAQAGLPKVFSLGQNLPNPANPATRISFAVPGGAGQRRHLSLKLYDARGNLVRTIFDGAKPAGYHSVLFDGRGLSSGIYVCRMEAEGFVRTRPMVITK